MSFNIEYLDLLLVGIAVAGIGLLGFIVYFNNTKSITNKSFLALSLLTIFWGISNYFEYKFTSTNLTLLALRLHIFISMLHAILFFQVSYVFPLDKKIFPNWYKFILLPISGFTALLTLTPFVFYRIVELAPLGQVTNPERGPGIVLFAIIAFGLLLAGILVLIIKILRSSGLERKQTLSFSTGMLLMACLIIIFNVILPIIFNNLTYIPFAALFVLPFIALTSYAILKHKLFNVKVMATGILVFILAIITFVEIIFAKNNLVSLIYRSSELLLILFFGVFLIKSFP